MSRPGLARLAALVALVVSGACSDTTVTPPSQLNFDRPIDISFACYGGLRITDGGTATPDQQVTTTAQPVEACTIRSGDRAANEPTPVPPGQEDLTSMGGAPIGGAEWYGFVLQSGPGTVSLSRFQTKPSSLFGGGDIVVQDSDPLTPGKNGISVGEDPVAIVGDRSGCWQLVANAGSCDLSALEVNTALDLDPDVNVVRLDVKNTAGERIDAKPAVMVATPGQATIGAACPATPTGLVYISYPSCHLVAAVDASTSTIVGGVRFDTVGASIVQPAELATLSCPSECARGELGTTAIRPIAIDFQEGEVGSVGTQQRLLIGAENSSVVTLIEIDEATSLPASVHPIPLEDPTGGLGVTAVALAPQIGMGGASGSINDDLASGGKFNFAYAITTDDTIRVVALDGAVEAGGGAAADLVECDTQIDPRVIYDVRSPRELSCFPVGRPTTPARRSGAKGPGIELVGDGIPTSIEIFRADSLVNDPRLRAPGKLVGYFGVITATNGATFILNVDDDDYPDFEDPGAPLEVQLPLAIAHQLRDALPERNLRALIEESEGVFSPICDTFGPDPDGQAGNSGGPRTTATPTRNIPSGAIAPEKAPELPFLRQLLCTGSDTTRAVPDLGFAAPDDVRELAYPDLRAVRDETWTLTWEGSLSNDRGDADTDGPAVRTSQIAVDGSGMRIVDATAPFCHAGVEDHDVVQLRGCDPSRGDAECPLGYSCFVHPQSQIAGIGACMLSDEADRLAEACKDFLTSVRRYTVGRAASGELRLLPRKSVLSTTPIEGCVDDAQCEALGDYAVDLPSSAHPRDDATAPDKRVWACMADPDRAPLDGPGQTGKRCVETCSETSECTVGRVCRAGVCMEGVVPPQACVNAPQRYELRAGQAFAVIGTTSGFVHSTIRDPSTDRCVRDPNAHPFEVGRIPLDPPACDPTADVRTGRLPDGTFEPNPCALTVDHTESVPVYIDDTCAAANPSTMLETRQAPGIRFRNRGVTMTLVDPTYPGDATCVRDRMGGLGNIPLVFGGYQLSWRQTAGFRPLVLPITPAFPVRVVKGPTESIWIIDHGDFLSTNFAQPSTRGRVYRIEAQGLTQINILE